LRREEGAAAVEFAIVGSVLVLILFGIMVYGLWLSEYSVMQGAAREGARVASTRGDVTAIEAAIRKAAGAYEPELSNMPPSVSVNGAAGSCSDETIGQLVTVTWDQTFKGDLLPFVPPLPNTKNVVGVFRCE
jgi:Flp pilus assembly protein TadG